MTKQTCSVATAIADFTADALYLRKHLKGIIYRTDQNAVRDLAFDRSASTLIWLCVGFFSLPGIFGVIELVCALKLTALHFQEIS
jgi:hypothetical protein